MNYGTTVLPQYSYTAQLSESVHVHTFLLSDQCNSTPQVPCDAPYMKEVGREGIGEDRCSLLKYNKKGEYSIL